MPSQRYLDRAAHDHPNDPDFASQEELDAIEAAEEAAAEARYEMDRERDL